MDVANAWFIFFRNLIVRRDEVGYGLTLSGDQPVFVQTVRGGGAADRAGIQENDCMLRVNGQRVTEASHQEVVGLIQGDLFNICIIWKCI